MASRSYKMISRALLILLLSAPASWAQDRSLSAKELAPLFGVFHVDEVTLSPDGRYLACTMREKNSVRLVLTSVDQPWMKSTVYSGTDETDRMHPERILGVARIGALRWVTANRLVYTIETPAGQRVRRRGKFELRAVDADGKNDQKLVDADDLVALTPGNSASARPIRFLGIATDAPDSVFVETQVPSTTQPFEAILPSADDTASADDSPIATPSSERETESGTQADVFRINIFTGKNKHWDEGIFAPKTSYHYLYDRAGHGRLAENDRLIALPFAGAGAQIPSALAGDASLLPKAGGNMPSFRNENSMPEAFRGGAPSFGVALRMIEYRQNSSSSGRWHTWDSAVSQRTGLVFSHADKDYYGSRSIPLAFDRDPNVLYYASNTGRDTYGLYAFDFRTNAHTPLPVESENLDLSGPAEVFDDSSLVFDRELRLAGIKVGGPSAHLVWLDQEIAGFQRLLEGKFTGRKVEILEWDDARNRFLVLVSGRSDPGRYYIFQKGRVGGLTEFFRRAPWLDAWELQPSETFSFVSPAGVALTGYMTLPRNSHLKPPALVLHCREIPGTASRNEFDRYAQALARMGFAVAEVNYRGSSGYGARHRDAAKAAFDRVPIEDMRATVDWLTAHYAVDPKRIALFGEGFGGYLALRATQLYPKEFRCAVTVDAPTELESWLNEDRTGHDESIALRRNFFTGDLKSLSLLREPERFTRPVLLIQQDESSLAWTRQGTRLRDALKRAGRSVEYWAISYDDRNDVDIRPELCARIGEFLFDKLYKFEVELGETKEVK